MIRCMQDEENRLGSSIVCACLDGSPTNILHAEISNNHHTHFNVM